MKKQVHALKSLESLKPYKIKSKETKLNEYGDYFLNGLAKIREPYKPVDFYDLTYDFNYLRIPSVSFSKFRGLMHVFKSVYNGDISSEDVKKEQIKL